MLWKLIFVRPLTEMEGNAKEVYRAMVLRFWPSFQVHSKREDVFLSRLLVACIIGAVMGGLFELLPAWSFIYWLKGILIGLGLGVATRPFAESSRLKTISSAMLGLALPAFSRLGYPTVGLIIFSAGLGALMSDRTTSRNTRIDTIIATALAALTGAWAVSQLDGAMYFNLGKVLSGAAKWAVMGFFIALGAIPLHIGVIKNWALSHARSIRRKLDPQYREYVDKALEKYLALDPGGLTHPEEIQEFLEKKARFEEALLLATESSLAWQIVDKAIKSIPQDELKKREQALRERYGTATQPGIKEEIEKALNGIQESMARLTRLLDERERIELQFLRMDLNLAQI